MAENEASLFSSIRGYPKPSYDGFCYNKHRANGWKTFWRCERLRAGFQKLSSVKVRVQDCTLTSTYSG